MRPFASKIISFEQALQQREAFRKAGEQVVWTNGCYDLLHAGHLASIEFARSQGDRLFLGVNTDASVRANKGDQRPVVPEADRAALLAGLEAVDYVVLYDEPDVTPLVEQLKPDVLVKGGDRAGEVHGQDYVERYGGRVALAPEVQGLSTTELIARIKQLD